MTEKEPFADLFWLLESQKEFEATRVGTDGSIADYNSVVTLLSRGIAGETAELIEAYSSGRIDEARTEGVDVLIFVAAVGNKLELSAKTMELMAAAAVGSAGEITEAPERHEEVRLDGLMARVDEQFLRQRGRPEGFDTVVWLSREIISEALAALSASLVGSTAEVPEKVANIFVYLAPLFTALGMTADDVSREAVEKIKINNKKYRPEFFSGVTVREGIVKAKATWNLNGGGKNGTNGNGHHDSPLVIPGHVAFDLIHKGGIPKNAVVEIRERPAAKLARYSIDSGQVLETMHGLAAPKEPGNMIDRAGGFH